MRFRRSPLIEFDCTALARLSGKDQIIMTTQELFSQFEASSATSTEEGLTFLEQHFRNSGEYHRLFDVLKMKIRRELGLGLLHRDDDPPVGEEKQQELEDRFLEACREIAELQFAQGNLNDGWIYLQPLGDEPFAKDLIESVEVTEDNFGAIIEIAFNNGVSPAYGYQLLLVKTGTCNGITAFDVQATQFERSTITELASVLVNHFYEELRSNVVDHVRDVKGEVDASATLGQLLEAHDWLVHEGGHHADATHLASIIRIARQTHEAEDLERALSLANYGCRLSEDFHFSSDPPFENIYEDHRVWFEALNGVQAAEAIDHFRKKADAAKGEYYETATSEALVDLQIRTGLRDGAVESMIDRILPQVDKDELPAAAFEVAKSSSQYRKLADAFRTQSNFAGYAFAVLCETENDQA